MGYCAAELLDGVMIGLMQYSTDRWRCEYVYVVVNW